MSELERLINAVKQEPSTGASDSVQTSINGEEQAALSEGEYVIPADVVSRLGEGSTDAGGRILDTFIKDLRANSNTSDGSKAVPVRDIIEQLTRTPEEVEEPQSPADEIQNYINRVMQGAPAEENLPITLDTPYDQMMQEIFRTYRNEAGQ